VLIIGNSHVSAFDNGISSPDEDVRVLWVGALRAAHFRQDHPSAQAVRREIAQEQGWTFVFVGNHDFQRLWEDARARGEEAAIEAAIPDWISMWQELAAGGRRVAWVRTVGQPPPGRGDALVEVLRLEALFARRIAPQLEALGVRLLDGVGEVRDASGRVDPKLLQADGLHLDPRHGGIVAKVLESCSAVALVVGTESAGRRFDTSKEEGSLGQLVCGRLGLPERALPSVEDLAATIAEAAAATCREAGREVSSIGPDTDLWKDRILDTFQLVSLWEETHRALGIPRGFDVDLRETSTSRRIAALILEGREGFPGFEDFVASLEDRGGSRNNAFRRLRRGGATLLERIERAESEALGPDHPYGIVDAWKAACDPDPRRALLAESRARSASRPFPCRMPPVAVGSILLEAVEEARTAQPLRRSALLQAGVGAMRVLAEAGEASHLLGALAAWDELLPESLEIQLLAARLGIVLEQRDEAMSRIERAEAIWSWNQETPLLRARLLIQEGRFQEALEQLKEQERRDPQAPGMVQVLEAFHQAVSGAAPSAPVRRDSSQAWIDAARMSRGWRRLEEIADLLPARSRQDIEALLADPEVESTGNPELLRAAAMIHLRIGNLEGGLRLLDSAVGVAPTFAPAQRDLGVARILRGDLEAAGASLDAAIRLDPRDAESHKALGHLRLRQGEREKALDCYGKALDLCPADQESWDVVDHCRIHDRQPSGLSGVTVIVYGRNDAHGQNLHKRAVVSLNALAEQLEPARDEILFVDCNSPEDVPTFPEAIADLLTERAKGLLRILRIRTAQYARLAPKAGQPVFEALCRNVALRSSSPDRHWVVSTNTDILLRSKGGKRLTDFVAELPEGFYGLPRFDIPQGLWQTLDRKDPVACLRAVSNWADAFGLRFAAQRPESFIRWENPGDFQLALRRDMVGIGGFDESMTKGPYHIDSNFARRLALLRGPVCSLEEWGECFHCDHSRQGSVRMLEAAVEANDWDACVVKVGIASIAEKQPRWGGWGETFEEVRLSPKEGLETALLQVVPATPDRFVLRPGGVEAENTDIPLARLLPFLADQILMLPSEGTLGILGTGMDLVEALSRLRRLLGHTGAILVSGPDRCDVAGATLASIESISRRAAMVVVDPGTRSGPIDIPRLRARFAALCARQMAIASGERARVLLLMAHFSWLGALGRKWLHVNQAPTSTSLFFGTVRDVGILGDDDFREIQSFAQGFVEDVRVSVPSGVGVVPVSGGRLSGILAKVSAGIRGTPASSPERRIMPGPGARILLDLRTLADANSASRGIGHYAFHLAKAILEQGRHRFGVLWDDRGGSAKRPELGGAPVEWVAYSTYEPGGWDLVHIFDPMGNHPDYEDPFTLFALEQRLTTTFYDLIPLHFYREAMGALGWEVYLTRLDRLKDSDSTHLCISRFTATDLVQEAGIDPERTEVVLAGLNAHHDPGRGEVEDDRIVASLGIQGAFCLYVGALDEHKNFLGAVQSWIRATGHIPGLKLVVVGRRNHIVEVFSKQLADRGLGEGVVFTGFVERWQLEALYRRAVATLFLSRFEGFGFPVLEAMAAGCPVICSDRTSIPEVAGDAAIVCDPEDSIAAAAALVKLHRQPALRAELVRKGLAQAASFTWDKVARAVLARWVVELQRLPRRTVPLRQAPATVEMLAPIYDPSGYASEARPFLQHLLESGLPVRTIPIGRCSKSFRDGTSASFRKLVSDSVDRRPVGSGIVRLIWFPGYAFRPDPKALRNIGRTTFETDSLPPDWVEACNRMDEIWVPCAFNLETFRNAGIRVPILVVPEGVDTARFRPGLEPLSIAGAQRSLTFLSVFEWSHRKGPDLLLAAWSKAFGPQDDVRLVVRTYPPNEIEGDPAQWVEKRIDEVLGALGTSRERCAPIVVIAVQVPEADMPRLYAAADVYLAPSRGEGWGRPHMEAMSCGVPVIATGWGGNLEFQNAENSWLIGIDGLEVIDEREEFPGYRGQRWAAPSVEDFSRLLALAASDRSERERKAARARADMTELWDWSRIAPVVEVRIREVLEGVPPEASRLSRGYRGITSEGQSTHEVATVRWVGPVFNYSGYARFAREAIGAFEDENFRCLLDPQENDPSWFAALRGDARAIGRWKGILERDPADHDVLVVCDIPRTADGAVDLLAQVAEAYPGSKRRIAWTMFETDSLPTGWAASLQRMEQVWVPSRHALESFVAGGVDRAKLRLVPLGIDATPFDAARGKPLDLPGPQVGTTFLSVFQWVRRKGWDLLLEAWSQAFAPGDDVKLVLRCHPFGAGPGIRSSIEAWCRSKGLTLDAMAPIVVLEEFVPEPEMPRLYEASDVFVLPSRGEGWGLPYLEAMAAGKPVIGVPWGGSADFLHEGVGWMLPTGEPVRVPEDALRENPFLGPSHRWADPKVADLVAALRSAASSPQERSRRGRRGAEDVRWLWTPETTARAAKDALSGAAEVSGVSDVRVEVPAAPAEAPALSIRWEGSQFVHHSLAHVNRELCLGLAKAGQDLSIIPYEPDQFAAGDDPDLGILAQLTNAPLEGECQVHVRHQWPPNLQPPAQGRWVVIQPWEFGSPPKEWMPAFRDRIDDLWVPSEYCRDLYLRGGMAPDRVHVVPNGVDCDRFRPGLAPLESLPPKRGVRFLYVGGTIARKGFDKLLNAWQKAFGPDDPVELLVKDMGGKTTYAGQTGEAYVRQIQESGRFARIHYVNTDLDPADLPSLYASGDVLVHPYRGEGFGLPMAEAMACGLPVVITQGGAADDFCGSAEGWMIPAERVVLPGGKVGGTETVEPAWWLEPSEDALVLALREAASDAQARARKGGAARARIVSGFTWEHAVAKAQERLAVVAARPVRHVQSRIEPTPEAPQTRTSTAAPSGENLESLSLILFQVETAVAMQDSLQADAFSREAVELHPDHPLAWLSRAMVLRGAGKSGKALEALSRSAALGGGAEVVYETMALHLQEGRNAPALVQWNLLRANHPQWVKERKAMHQSQGLPWLPDRFAKPGKPPKKPAGKKR
jgi:glycosyltransferase involved in cell wall biosynthesis/tetratricopeptide (TPR) repeat protein